jgi:tctex1 domain-containing protein 2
MPEETKAEDKSYAVRPHFRKKFRPLQVTEIIQQALNEKLMHQKYHVDKASKWTKELSETIKTKLKELDWDRYKYVVQVVIGEQRGEGIKMGTRCFWDSDTDNFAKATFMNDSLFAVGVAFGVYLY